MKLIKTKKSLSLERNNWKYKTEDTKEISTKRSRGQLLLSINYSLLKRIMILCLLKILREVSKLNYGLALKIN